ncbi:uncharacterized protein LOC132904000 [Amyelois transitella]|uniref:uncharacterized protein LOC132904000 n=1 Tax=Amyelois transitella TaxID=680683 RepID=UPI00298F963A|nr:uncharacterized protein LOC132904000 [Amyelois transitella]
MDSFVKNIKSKISGNNLVDMMKEANVIDEDKIKEQQVRKALSNIDPNHELSIEDMASRLNDLPAARSKTKSKTQEAVDVAKSSLSVLQKFTGNKDEKKERKEEEPHPYLKEDNIFNLYDDFH